MIQKKTLHEYAEEHYGLPFANRLKYNADLHLNSLTLKNRSVLEIGAGDGFLTASSALRGATRIVALEPEAAGSTTGVQDGFAQMSQAVGLPDTIEYKNITFDQFCDSYDGQPFDYILMNDVINHLDENATTRLHRPDALAEKAAFVSIFEKMYRLLLPGGVLSASDLGRYNFWNAIHLTNPVAPTIEWHKHQQPIIWARLLAKAQFDSLKIKWCTACRLRKLSFLLARKWPAYFHTSAFVITAHKTQ